MEVQKNKQIMVAIGAFLLMFASAIVSNSTGYFIVAVRDAIKVSAAQFAAYYTILQMTTACVSLAIGFLYSRFSMRQIFLTGAIGTGIGFLIMSRVTSLWMVYAGAFVIGLFQALVIVPIVRVVNQWIPGKNNGLVIGLVMSATGFGGLMMGQVMPRVVTYISWRTGYLVCAGMFVVITMIGLILAGGTPPTAETTGDGNSDASAKDDSYLHKVFSMPAFYIILICCLLGCGANVIVQHISAHLQYQGVSVEYIALIMSIWSVGLAVSKIVLGWIYGRVPQQYFVPIYMLISAVAYLPMLSKSVGVLTVGVALVGLSGAGITAIYPSIINGIFGKEMTSAIWGFCWAAFQFGNAICVIGYGAVYDITGSYNTGFIIGGVLTFIVGIIFTLFLISNQRKEKAEAAQ